MACVVSGGHACHELPSLSGRLASGCRSRRWASSVSPAPRLRVRGVVGPSTRRLRLVAARQLRVVRHRASLVVVGHSVRLPFPPPSIESRGSALAANTTRSCFALDGMMLMADRHRPSSFILAWRSRCCRCRLRADRQSGGFAHRHGGGVQVISCSARFSSRVLSLRHRIHVMASPAATHWIRIGSGPCRPRR